jgi:ABC-type transport system substrate-binding protein
VRAPATASPGAGFFADVADVAAPDDRHLVITLTGAAPPLPQRLALPFATPLKKGRHELGTGPFVLLSWARGERLVFVRNPRYWDPELPYLDRIVLEPLVPPSVAALRFESGELDTVDRLDPDDYLRFAGAPAWQPYIVRTPLMAVYGEGMNVTRKPFDDRRVRLALNYALDKEDTVRLYNGRAVVARAILPPGLPGHDPGLASYPHDPARARRLLADAGYPDGFDVTYTTITDPALQLVAQSVQADLAQVGVRVRIATLTFPAYLAAVGRGELDFFYAAWTMDFPDPQDFLEVLFHSRSILPENSVNYGHYARPDLDDLLDRARVETEPARRLALYRQAERLIHDDCPWVFHYHPLAAEVRQPEVMGYRPHPVWLRDYRRAWLARSSSR